MTASNSGVKGTVASVKWMKEYRRYRSCRCQLYMCMILLMIFVALSVACVTTLFTNSFYFHPVEYELNKGETRAVQVSTLFCEGVVVKSASFSRRVVVVSSLLKRHAAKDVVETSVAVLLRRDRYWYRSFYLLKQSAVSIRVVSEHSINVYWLKGRKILQKWTKQISQDLKHSSSHNTESFTGTSMTETFTVNEDNNYYLGITSVAGNSEYSEIFVNISINHIVYDLSSYITSCNASVGMSCKVVLRFNSPDTAVIMVSDNRTLRANIRSIWYCRPRIWFYAAVFGGCFVLVILLLWLIYCSIMSKISKKMIEKKSHVPTRVESFTTGAVTLQSINNRGSTSDETCENALELTPLRLVQSRQTRQDNHHCEKYDAIFTSTPSKCDNIDAIINNNTQSNSIATAPREDTDGAYSDNEIPKITLSQRTPSPRWSTFLQDADDEYEECVTNFLDSPFNTFESVRKAEEDKNFENELMDRLLHLTTDYDGDFNGPIETNIDDYDESETDSFLHEAELPSHQYAGQIPDSGIIMRPKTKRKEQRWEPRLSVVTEV